MFSSFVNDSYRMLRFVKKALFHLSDNKNVQRFQKRAGLQILWLSSHEYPHVEKIKNLCEQTFKGEANNTEAIG